MSSAIERSSALDALRGVAISLVVLHHYRDGPILNFGWTGVDLFFVLSGFLIGGILIDNRGSENYFSTFYLRRAARILPTYAIFLLLYFSMEGISGPVWPFLTFAQNIVWASAGTTGPAMISVTWSLAVEEQFYLCLPFLIWAIRPTYLPWVLSGLIALAPLVRMFAVFILHWPAICAYYLLPCRMDGLLLGVLAAWAIRQPSIRIGLESHRRALTACLIVGLLGDVLLGITSIQLGETHPGALPMWTVGYTWIDLTYALVLLTVVTAQPSGTRKRGPLAALGLGAYSIYLFHTPVLDLMYRVTDSNNWAEVLSICALAVIAILNWILIERPAISFGRRHWRYERNVTRVPTILRAEAD